MVAGDPSLRTFDPANLAHRAVSHMCMFKNRDGSEETNSLPLEQCNDIRSQVTFPSCWDGQNLDSADHKSHVGFSLSLLAIPILLLLVVVVVVDLSTDHPCT